MHSVPVGPHCKWADPPGPDCRNVVSEDGSSYARMEVLRVRLADQARRFYPFHLVQCSMWTVSKAPTTSYCIWIKRTNKDSKCQCTLSNRWYLIRYNDSSKTFPAQAQLGSRLTAQTQTHFKFLQLAWKDLPMTTAFKIPVTTKAVPFFRLYLSLCCWKTMNEPK